MAMHKRSDESQKIMEKLDEIARKLDQILELQNRQLGVRASVPTTLASLPDHLRKTAYAIATMGEATAKQVASETRRTRAAESDYLNQLASRGFLKKQRKRRDVYFQVFALYVQCPKCGARVPMTLDHCTMCGAALVQNNR